jgi:hypothetical protein
VKIQGERQNRYGEKDRIDVKILGERQNRCEDTGRKTMD